MLSNLSLLLSVLTFQCENEVNQCFNRIAGTPYLRLWTKARKRCHHNVFCAVRCGPESNGTVKVSSTTRRPLFPLPALSKIYFKYKNASPTARLHGAPLAQPPSVPYLRQPAECTSVYAKLHCCNIHTPLRLFYRVFPFPISSKAPITQNCRPIWCYCKK